MSIGPRLFEPGGAAVLIAGTSGSSTVVGALCRNIDFYTSAAAAEAQLSTDPALEGFVVDQDGALGIAGIVVGPLLGGGDR